MLNNYIESDIFQSTIQKLTFTNCISLHTLCKYSYYVDCYKETGHLEHIKLSNAEYNNKQRRYGRIFEKLCVDKPKDQTHKKLISKPKTYDKYMFDSQIKLYNHLSSKAGYTSIKKDNTVTMIKNTRFSDEANIDYDFISKFYPYYTDGKRDGVSFIECILLMNMYSVLLSQRLSTLDLIPKSKVDKKRIKAMIEEVTASINSSVMFELYILIFLEVFQDTVYKKQNFIAENALRSTFLPDDSKNKKDVFSVWNRYFNRFIKRLKEDYNSSVHDLELIDKNPIKYEYQYNKAVDLIAINYITDEVLPFILYVTAGSSDGSYLLNNDAKRTLYTSHEYLKIITKYIDIAKAEAIKILNKLYKEKL